MCFITHEKLDCVRREVSYENRLYYTLLNLENHLLTVRE